MRSCTTPLRRSHALSRGHPDNAGDHRVISPRLEVDPASPLQHEMLADVRFGSKRTSRPLSAMSALPPIADIEQSIPDVRSVPISDIRTAANSIVSLDPNGQSRNGHVCRLASPGRMVFLRAGWFPPVPIVN